MTFGAPSRPINGGDGRELGFGRNRKGKSPPPVYIGAAIEQRRHAHRRDDRRLRELGPAAAAPAEVAARRAVPLGCGGRRTMSLDELERIASAEVWCAELTDVERLRMIECEVAADQAAAGGLVGVSCRVAGLSPPDLSCRTRPLIG
jgi:hypothetical protein